MIAVLARLGTIAALPARESRALKAGLAGLRTIAALTT